MSARAALVFVVVLAVVAGLVPNLSVSGSLAPPTSLPRLGGVALTVAGIAPISRS